MDDVDGGVRIYVVSHEGVRIYVWTGVMDV